MYWEIREVTSETDAAQRALPPEGRFVLHRHRDTEGPHLDLRLECGDVLLGWRVAGGALEAGAWATEKAPHPVHWLDQDGEAVREDAGRYRWVWRDDDAGELLLHGADQSLRVKLERRNTMPASCVRDLCAAAREHGVGPGALAGLVADGVTARHRAVGRLCGLAAELDGAAFDETLWRETLAHKSLAEIQGHLHAYEVRFDRKYPPERVSRPEKLPEVGESAAGSERVLELLRG